MAKTKFKFKITGLELEFEGNRDELPTLSAGVAEQISGLLNAPGVVADPAATRKFVDSKTTTPDAAPAAAKKRAKNTGGKRTKAEPLNWRHEPDKWGTPSQEWNPTNKSLWLMYVAENENGTSEFTASLIASTFNAMFKEAKLIRGSNVSRDLSKAKSATPSLVGSSSTGDVDSWFLTQAGKKLAEELVKEARGLPKE